MRELGIGFVLNLCPEWLAGSYADLTARLAEAGIKQLTWPAGEARDFDIVSHVVNKGACDFIEMGLRSAGVLVNCVGFIVLYHKLVLILWDEPHEPKNARMVPHFSIGARIVREP